MSGTKEIMRTRKKKWGHYALPEGFAEHKYPKDYNYLTTRGSTADHMNLNYGYRTIFKP
jgi:hypothetical protein